MTQRTDHHYRNDFQQSYSGSDSQNKWIWGALAALATLALFIWLAMSGTSTVDRTSTGSVTPAPQVEQPVAPALEPVQPVQPVQPAPGGGTSQP